MIKPSVIISWPRHMDYPWFRYNLPKFREFFSEIFIVFTQDTVQPDISSFIVANMRDVKFIYPQKNYEDWRQCAVREVLDNKISSEYVLFLEQDFLMTYNFMLVFIAFFMEYEAKFAGYKEGERIHPAFSLVSRDVIEKTHKEFSAQPPKYDHFGLFFEEVGKQTKFFNITDFGCRDKADFYHIAGLTQNYHVFKENQVFYRPEEFLAYNALSLQVPVNHNVEFTQLCRSVQAKHGSGESDVIKKFFTIV